MFKQIGTRIKTARQNAGFTQEQLAEHLGCSSSFISRLETGRVSTSLEKLYDISIILNVGLENLLYDFLSQTSPYPDPMIVEISSKLAPLPAEYKQAFLEIVQSLSTLYR